MTRQETAKALEALKATCQEVDAQLDALGALACAAVLLAWLAWRRARACWREGM